MNGPPVPFIGFDPTDHPGRLPAQVEQGGAGAGGGGLVVREIVGICFAFDSPAMTDTPLWVRVDGPGTV